MDFFRISSFFWRLILSVLNHLWLEEALEGAYVAMGAVAMTAVAREMVAMVAAAIPRIQPVH